MKQQRQTQIHSQQCLTETGESVQSLVKLKSALWALGTGNAEPSLTAVQIISYIYISLLFIYCQLRGLLTEEYPCR